MRRRDREITDEAVIDEIIRNCKVCRVGFNDNGEVYIVPLSFGYVHKENARTFYFHGAKEGRKIELVKSSPKVGFELDTNYQVYEMDTPGDYSARFQSVIGTGRISELTDCESKREGLTEIMNATVEQRNWVFDEKSLDHVAVLKLEVESISCKSNMPRDTDL